MFFLLGCAIPLFFFDWIVEQIKLIYILSFGIILSALSFLTIPYLSSFDINDRIYLYIAMFFHGFFFSPVTPALIEVMGKWYDKEGRGMIMGFWASNDDFGIIIGLQLGHHLFHFYNFEWETYFYITGCIMLLFGLYNFFFLNCTL